MGTANRLFLVWAASVKQLWEDERRVLPQHRQQGTLVICRDLETERRRTSVASGHGDPSVPSCSTWGKGRGKGVREKGDGKGGQGLSTNLKVPWACSTALGYLS